MLAGIKFYAVHHAKFVDHPLHITMELSHTPSRFKAVSGQIFCVDSIFGVPEAERTRYDDVFLTQSFS